MTTAATGSTAASAEPPSADAFTVRRATADDIPALVAMLADDPLGATRESPDDPAPYRAAFARIDADPNQQLVVAERDGRTVGTLQLTVIPGLSRRGASRALIEAVRVHADARGTGLGTRLITWAIEEARRQGCALVQLTSDATRLDAHRFYERLGFEASHLGFKMPLE
ncbi:GNAT family N-acetyltransferase [Streptomyces albus subsp. chlorinus]|uniref:GNAT family N-acetyltransferase n=1 Tax=Streptomyces albus TaxID=1888 RepID=UPI00156F59F3|nr:GNAT family N-acetyltransferase [Streptomyces albus]NSC22689.1 GNAT family N-acetyltransferase [Streptomyces albus subsp. chlorinus]